METQFQELTNTVNHNGTTKFTTTLLTADFPVSDKLRPYREQLIKDFYDSHKNNEGVGYSREVKVKEVYEIVKPLWLDLLSYHFHPLPNPRGKFQIWAYIQNNTNNFSVWHNHPESEINTVFYLDAPKEGGELELLHVNPDGAIFEKMKVPVEDDKLYMMPFWTYHRPLAQKDNKERICFNIQYRTEGKKRLKQRNGINW